MNVDSKNEFFNNYELHYKVLLGYQLILIIIYRLLTLFISTETLHHIPFITPDQLQIIYGILELLFCLFFLINLPLDSTNQKVFLILLLLNVFFEVLYILQYIILTDPIIFSSYDMNLILLQVIVLLPIILLSNRKFRIDFKNGINNLHLFLFFSFFFLLMSSLLSSSPNYYGLFILLADVLFWIFLLTFITHYAKILYNIRKIKAVIPILVGFFLGFGMYMGMTGNQLMLTVITTIIDRTFSLHAVEPLIFGISFRLLMIFFDVVLGFIFFSVLFVSFFTNETRDEDLTIYAILGLTGLAVIPLLAIMRFIAFFKLVQIKPEKA